MISLTIQADIPHLSLHPSHLDGVRKSAANEILLLLKENFARLGGRRYYMQAADSTKVTADATSAIVTVSHVGVRLRWLGSDKALGGPLKPGSGTSSKTGEPTKLLAIPAKPSIRRAPGAYGDLQYVPLPDNSKIKAMLVIPAKKKDSPAKAGKRRRKGGNKKKQKPNVAFWLATETDHPARPEVMPTEDQIKQAATDGARSFLQGDRIKRPRGGISIPSIQPDKQPVKRRRK